MAVVTTIAKGMSSIAPQGMWDRLRGWAATRGDGVEAGGCHSACRSRRSRCGAATRSPSGVKPPGLDVGSS
jgi:hypothetical protein